jgi:putative membrane protein
MLRTLALRWAVVFIAVFVAGYIVPDYISYKSLNEVALFAVILALLNTFIRPVALLVTCPVNLFTLGLFTLVVNALIFWFAGSLVPAIYVNGFLGAFIGAVIVSVVTMIMNRVVKK